jgi:hypothetical protein
MAIRIPILTSFDPKGLKQANSQLNRLQGDFKSLGRNMAVAGAVVGAAFVAIGKSVKDAAESQKVFAQTEAVLRSTGTTANGTAKQISELASSLQKSTAFNDEAILSGQNLLLTFKGIQNQAGAGNDIFNQASQTMLDFARAMNTGPEQAAIKLGKALQDPTKGVTALRKSGVDFTADQMNMIKALQESGDLMGAQKIVLAELQTQFGGSAAAYAGTFAGQVDGLNNDLGDLSEEIGAIVMPALTGMVGEFRNLIPVIGPQLKAAIESVDWAALIKSVVDFTTFILKNAEAIAKTMAAIWLLSTAYKTITVLMGLSKLAIDINTWAVARNATAMGGATVAAGLLRTAMMLLPWALAAAGLALIVAGMTEVDSSYRTTTPVVTSWGQEVLKTGDDASWAAGKYGVLKTAIDAIPKNVKINVQLETTARNNQLSAYLGFLSGKAAQNNTGGTGGGGGGGGKGGGGAKTKKLTLGEKLKREATIVKKQTRLISKGVSEGLAARLTGGSTPIKRANKALKAIAANNGKLTKNLKKLEKNLKAGTKSTTSAISEPKVDEALEARKRAFESFTDSVKSTFAGIKNSIMSAFDITELGGSTDAITRNMDKLLVRLRAFATNISKLSGMGLNPALLQQVISAGPMAGAALAENLVMGGTGALAAINAGYNEFGTLSSQIATTGTNALYGTAAQQTIYNI